jgi:RNA polymerase sigma-54 factor
MSGFSQSYAQKQSLNLSLKQWLPILQTPLQDLEKYLKNISYENPFLDVTKPKEQIKKLRTPYYNDYVGNSLESSFVENTLLYEESLTDKLIEQIVPPTFPTPNSQKVALEIIQDIDDAGFFDGDIQEIATLCSVTDSFVESIRLRFATLEPTGIGARDMEESFLFQLDALERPIDNELYEFTCKVIDNLKQMDKFVKHHRFEEAKELIKGFNQTPSLHYVSDDPVVVPDFFVSVGDDIDIKANSQYYPDIKIKDSFKNKSSVLKEKLKEARDTLNLLQLRKNTLYNIVMLIVQKQISFFVGGELKPYTMRELAGELGYDESTISRAVSNKYIECERGVFSMKSFFTNAVSSKGISSSELKSFMQSLIEYEDHETPLTDQDILDKIEQRYGLKMVRRTITKYRKLLDIPSSKERKKLYKIG